MVKYFSKSIFLAALICICVFYLPVFKFNTTKQIISLFKTSEIVEVSGVLISSPVKSSSGKTYSATLELLKAKNNNCFISDSKGFITVLIPSELIEVYFPGKLYTATKKEAHLYESGANVTLKGSIANGFFLVSDCTSCHWPNKFTGKIDYFRALCRLQFKRLMFSWGEAGGLLLALLCGAKEYTDEATKAAFKNAGLSHILALSGMHLSMFSSIALFLGNKLKNRKAGYLLKIVFLILFVWFAGLSPSLLRAFICSNLMLLSCIISTEKPDPILILCISFLTQAIISPSDISNVGFILSYTALLGIFLFQNHFLRFLQKILPKYLSSTLSSSISAQIFTCPISLKLFGTFSPIGIIATSVISPLLNIFIYGGLILIIVTLIFPVLQSYSGIFVNFLYTIIKYIVLFFSKAPRIIL